MPSNFRSPSNVHIDAHLKGFSVFGSSSGAKEMYSDGVLATVDVTTLADAHVRVFEAMIKTASGRYICFDRVIDGEDDAARLAGEMGMPVDKIRGGGEGESSREPRPRFELSNRKLSCLMSRSLRPCYDESRTV